MVGKICFKNLFSFGYFNHFHRVSMSATGQKVCGGDGMVRGGV